MWCFYIPHINSTIWHLSYCFHLIWKSLGPSMEKAMAPHSSTLAWKIPWTEEPYRLQSMGLIRVTQLSNFTFTFHFLALEKEMATYSCALAWRIPGMVEPGGLPSMESHRVGHYWSNLTAAAAACPTMLLQMASLHLLIYLQYSTVLE